MGETPCVAQMTGHGVGHLVDSELTNKRTKGMADLLDSASLWFQVHSRARPEDHLLLAAYFPGHGSFIYNKFVANLPWTQDL